MADLLYIPAPQESSAFNRRIAKLGGYAPNGLARLKVVWGMDEKEFRAGRDHEIKYPSFDKDELGMPYWIVEQWHPSTVFSEETWETDRWENGVDLLGPFPRNGFYGMLFPWFSADSSYAPLNESLFEQIKLTIRARDDKSFDQKLLVDQQKRKEEMRKQATLDRLLLRNENFDRYFSREDYYTQKRGYSFTSRIVKPVRTEKRTASGIILPE